MPIDWLKIKRLTLCRLFGHAWRDWYNGWQYVGMGCDRCLIHCECEECCARQKETSDSQ